MLKLRHVRDLDLQEPPQKGRPAHLSAASGLVRAGDFLYVVADDELHLGVFPATGKQPGVLLRLKAGELPDAQAARKAAKPDLESLVMLAPSSHYPHGALLAMGSGSRSNRRIGFLIELAEQGAAINTPRSVELSAVFAAIAGQVQEINIEGAMISGDRLRLLQRGNKGAGRNAVIDLKCEHLARQLHHGVIEQVELQHIAWFDLGDVQGVPLCFSDGVALADDSIVFTSVAEDTDDNYADGRCVGAAVGIINANGNLRTLRRLARPLKIEGIEARVDGNVVHTLLVTDADNPQVPASLYATELTR